MSELTWEFDHVITYENSKSLYYTSRYKDVLVVKNVKEKQDGHMLYRRAKYILNCGERDEITFSSLGPLIKYIDTVKEGEGE